MLRISRNSQYIYYWFKINLTRLFRNFACCYFNNCERFECEYPILNNHLLLSTWFLFNYYTSIVSVFKSVYYFRDAFCGNS